MTILIADSSQQIIDRLESLVSETDAGLNIHKATTFHGALQLFDEYKPDVVLLDMNLTDNKSFTLLNQMKGRESGACIIALSDHMTLKKMEQCKQRGADFVLDKFNEFEKIPGLIKNQSEISDGKSN